MLIRLWRSMFPKPEPVAAPKPPEPTAEPEIVYVSAFHHDRIAYMIDPRRDALRVMDPDSRFENPLRGSFPELTAEAKTWLDANTPGYTYKMSGANFIIGITFVNPNDAVKFKLFWM